MRATRSRSPWFGSPTRPSPLQSPAVRFKIADLPYHRLDDGGTDHGPRKSRLPSSATALGSLVATIRNFL